VEGAAKQILPQGIGTLQGEALNVSQYGFFSDPRCADVVAVFVLYVILAILTRVLAPHTVLSSLPVALLGGLSPRGCVRRGKFAVCRHWDVYDDGHRAEEWNHVIR